MEQNKEKLRELDSMRKAKEELQAEFDQFREDMAESSETIEMLTLDKEMAEEAAEIARSEVEDMKIRLEEAETDLELLRAESHRVALADLVALFVQAVETVTEVHYFHYWLWDC